MHARSLVSLFAIGLAASLNVAPSQAANLTITDTCGRTVGGSASSSSPDPVVVNGNGDITVTGYSSTGFAAGLGQCAPVPADGKPICTLSASSGRVAKNTPVTLSAACTAETNEYIWLGTPQPVVDPNPSSASSISLQFDKAGAYTYTVTGKRGGVSGVVSAPVTILVGDASDLPTCSLTLSPPRVTVNGTATAQVVCQPQQDSLVWATPEPASGAPATPPSPDAYEDLTFNTVGTFTYKVFGRNTAGDGPTASASVTVVDNSTLSFRGSATKVGGGLLTFPAGLASTDYLILYITAENTPISPAISGWTQKGATFSWSTGRGWSYILARTVGTATNVTIPGSTNANAMLLAYRGTSGTGQIGTFIETASTANTCTRSLTGLTPAGYTLGIVTDRIETVSPSAPTGFTSRVTFTGGIFRSNLSDRVTTSSSSGTVTFTQATANGGACVLLELLP